MNLRLSCFFALSLLAFGFNRHSANAQENENWVPDSIKSTVTELLKKYEFYHNSLSSDSDPDKEISFIRLFANPKILVLSDFAGDSAISKISIQDYSASIIENFPKGVTVRLLFSSLMIGKPHFDRNDRYILKARITQSKTGISELESRVHMRYFSQDFISPSIATPNFCLNSLSPSIRFLY